jgi:DNA processing protein
VVQSDLHKGGTWTGAVEQLERLNLVPIYIRASGEPAPGLAALRSKGALPWPNPQDAGSLSQVFRAGSPPAATSLDFGSASSPEGRREEAPAPVPPPAEPPPTPLDADRKNPTSPADRLLRAVWTEIEQLLKNPMEDAEVAAALDVSTSQARRWLKRLVDDGFVETTRRPLRYSLPKQPMLLGHHLRADRVLPRLDRRRR